MRLEEVWVTKVIAFNLPPMARWKVELAPGVWYWTPDRPNWWNRFWHKLLLGWEYHPIYSGWNKPNEWKDMKP